MLANCYLEGHYTEIYPDKSRDEAGMLKFFRQFSFPGGIGSHCTPETPGSIHEGGELGYSISHAYGAAFDNPDLHRRSSGRRRRGGNPVPLATSWHSNKFLNPIRDGAVLPVLHLNGYKIANPTILGRIPHQELEALFTGYGTNLTSSRATIPSRCTRKWLQLSSNASSRFVRFSIMPGQRVTTTRPRWPMLVLRSPKGWTGPKEVNGHKVEDSWRAHQVPVLDPATNKQSLKVLENWMRSYKPEELFDANGTLIPSCRNLRRRARAASRPTRTRTVAFCAKSLICRIFATMRSKLNAAGAVYASPNGGACTLSCRSNAPEYETPSVSSARMRQPPTGSPQSTLLRRNLACRIQTGRR